MRIIAIRRSQQDAVAPLDWIGTADQLDKLLSESDFVVVACDMNEETIGMIDAPQIAKMKPSGIIINVARGRIIAEEPLYNALKNKKIGGAVLDVWYNYIGNDQEEVSPSNCPFEQLDNVILSAHESASAPEQVERRWKFVAENICRVTDGETAKNIVFVGREEATH
jgi:phosphoglycerate dehydrogenase-like enzyme